MAFSFRPLLLRREARQVVDPGGIDTRDISANFIAERGLSQELRPWCRSQAGNQPVLPKRFTIEKHGGSELLVEPLVVGPVEAPGIDTQLGQQASRDFAVATGTLDGLGAAVSEQPAIPRPE